MSFETFRRVLVLCFVSISFCTVVTAREGPNNRNLPNYNETIRKGKALLYPPKIYYAENRVDLDQPTRSLLTTVLNAAGVCGLGFLWIKEITAALGTPILAPFLMPPLLLLTATLLFLPQIRDVIENLVNKY